MIDSLEFKTGTRLNVAFTILREAAQQTKHLQRNDVLALQPGFEPRSQSRKIEVLPTTILGIWRQFAKYLEQRRL
ncbi:hypothetical protein D3C81_1968200 [compost metagenome]